MVKSTQKGVKAKTVTKQRPEIFVAASYESAIGVDVHAELLVCAYQWMNENHEIETEHAEFGTRHSELEAFAEWCCDCSPSIIVMESTGVLWRSAYEALERAGFTSENLALVNARDVKAIIGRKTDKEDAQRLAEIARLGNIKKSFIPPFEFRNMRQLARRYQTIVAKAASHTNVYHKLLSSAGCRATSVFSNVRGKAATVILEAKLNNVPDFEQVVRDHCKRLHAKPEEIMDALNFEISPEMRDQLNDEREQLREQALFAQRTLDRLRELQKDFSKEIDLLQTIPGIKEVSARLIFAELCTDLKDHFVDSEHFCSWLGICPGNKISANKSYSGSAAKGNKWLRRTLIECAQGIGLSKYSFRDRFNVLKLRRGTRRAIVAIAHLLARVIFSVLTNGKAFVCAKAKTLRDEVVNRLRRTTKQLKRLTPVADREKYAVVDCDTGVIVSRTPVAV